MAISLATIEDRVLARLAADMATPSYAKIHSNNITAFANEAIHKVVWHYINKFIETKIESVLQPIQALQKLASLTLATGTGDVALPTDFEFATSVVVTPTASTTRQAKIYYDADGFRKWDSSNFLRTPNAKFIVALIENGKLYVKPLATSTTYKTALMDYIKTHPTLSGSQATVFDSNADAMLEAIIAMRVYDFLEEPELSNKAVVEAGMGA